MSKPVGITTCKHCKRIHTAQVPKLITEGKTFLICPKCNRGTELFICGKCGKTVYEPNHCPDELEFTPEMIARNDEIDNAVFDCLKTLSEKELDWNMELIADATEGLKCSLLSVGGHRVRHYSVVTNDDGSQEYCDELEVKSED